MLFGCGVILKVITNIILIPIPGVYEKGAVIGNLFCYMTAFIIVYTVLKNSIKLDFRISEMIIKPLIITIIMCIISISAYNKILSIEISPKIATIFGITIAIIIYTILIILFKVFSKEEIFLLPNGKKIYKILKKCKIY